MQIEHDKNGGSEQPSCSDVGQILALRKIVREEFELMVLDTDRGLMTPMVIATLQKNIKPLFKELFRSVVQGEIQKLFTGGTQKDIKPLFEELFRGMVQEEIQKLLTGGTQKDIKPFFEELFRSVVKDEIQKLLTGGTRNVLPNERSLQLKFSDEVCGPVQTGNELTGKNNECLKLALFGANGQIVTCGPESSAEVEIVLLDASGNDDENNTTRENFERRIIRAGEKEKPHFAKRVYIKLEKGVGSLIGLKLGHDEKWTKLCNCRLGARILQNLDGTIVQEAWTKPFEVIDKRGKQYEKHYPPSPSSEVWRLKEISRDGEPCNRLKEQNIETVKDFRFWLSVNFEGLQKEILRAGKSRWSTIITHAKECIIDDKMMYYHESSTGPLTGVIYNAVGELKGVIDESQFVPVANLSADKKDNAEKLLMSVLEPSAFVQRFKISFNDEDALLQQFQNRSSDSTDPSSKYLNGSENIHGYPTTGPDLSSQSMVPELEICDVTRHSGSLGSKDTGELRDTGPCLFPEAGDTPTDPDVLGLCFENHCFTTRLQSENHELLVTGTVGGSSGILPDTSLFSASSTMNSFGENGAHEDFGSSRSATDHMASACGGSDTRHIGALQCSPDISNFEEFLKHCLSSDTDLTFSENVHEYQTTGPCFSPQSIIPELEVSIGATDDMEIIMQCNRAWPCSPSFNERWMNESKGDEESAADEPQIDNSRTNSLRWKKLLSVSKWFSVRRRVALDVRRNRKKQKVG